MLSGLFPNYKELGLPGKENLAQFALTMHQEQLEDLLGKLIKMVASAK